MAENSFTRMPLTQQLVVSLVVGALICGGFYFFWWTDAVTQEQTKTSQLARLQADLRKLEVAKSQLPKLQKELEELEAQLKVLKTLLPPEDEMPDLIRKVQYLASNANLEGIRKFTPGAIRKEDFYEEHPINIEVDGSYHNLARFFDRVGRLQRLVNMGDVNITSQSKQTVNNTIKATCVARTYVYVEPPPGAPGAPGAAGGRPPARR